MGVTAYIKQCRRAAEGGAGFGAGFGAGYGSKGGYGKGPDPRHQRAYAPAGSSAPRRDSRAWEGGGGHGGHDSQLRRFLARYPIDERANDYLCMQGRHIIDRVISGFKPKREGESDYSAIVMSFTKRCRDDAGGDPG